MSCNICGGDVTTNGDGDLLCQGDCGEILLRENIEDSFEDEYADEDEYDADDEEIFEDDGQPTMYEEYQDLYGGDDSFDCYDEY